MNKGFDGEIWRIMKPKPCMKEVLAGMLEVVYFEIKPHWLNGRSKDLLKMNGSKMQKENVST
jgi:hypothetical protein